MRFKPNLSVKEGLDHLAKRLDPIICDRLASDLGDHPWTVVLEILDEKRGYTSGYKYWTHDLQAQLRMLTERLGDFGYPFDDRQRTVSTIGNELRIVRKQMAHMHDFTVDEAFRANDFSVRLLDYFRDAEGLDEAKRVRHEALKELAVQEGLTELAAAEATSVPSGQIPELAVLESDNKAAAVKPDPEVLVREATVIGNKRLEFESWAVVQVGGIDILDDLPRKAAKDKVRAVAVEIATYEGPVHIERLTDRTAQSFGLKRIRSSRARKISYQIRQAGLFIDENKFVWPREIDPAVWTEFRPNDGTAERPFIHVSPNEIANAGRFLRACHPGIAQDDLEVAVLRTFGRERRTKQVTAHLAKARELM